MKDKTKEVTGAEHALNWCLQAYLETRTQGYYTAYNFRNVSYKNTFNIAAKPAGLVEQFTDDKGKAGHRWKDMSRMPNISDGEKLWAEHDKYMQKEKARNKANNAKRKAARAAAKQKDLAAKAKQDPPVQKLFKPVPRDDQWSEIGIGMGGTHIETRLIRIEAKMNKLLNIWDSK